MPITEISAEQAQQLLGDATAAPQTREISREEALQNLEFSEEFQPIEVPPAEKPGFVSRIVQRALGTDVNDPLELERLGTVLTGGIGGSIAGSRTPIAPGPAGVLVNPITGAAFGGLAGVVAGAVAPEAALETGEFVGVLSPGTRDRLGLSNQDLRRVVEGEALLELVTMGAATGLRAAGRGISQLATGTKAAEKEFAQEAAEAGVELAPFQLGDRGLGRGIINVLGRFPMIGSKARKVNESAEASMRMVSEGASHRVANVLGASEVGESLWRDAQGTMKKFSKEIGKRYDDLFLEAAELGVPYRMDNTREATVGVLRNIAERAPRKKIKVTTPDGQTVEKVVPAKPAAAGVSVRKFLGEEGYSKLVNLSLGQSDEAIKKIDQHIATVDKGIRNEVIKLLSPVRGALKADIATNGIGQEAKQVAQKLSEIDADFSAGMAQMFETTAAQKLSAVQKGGLKSSVAPSQRATRLPPDKLARYLVDLDSPQVMDELSRLVTPRTYREMASLKIAEQFDKAITVADNTTKLNAEMLAKSLGLSGGAATSSRRKGVEKMLEHSGGLNINDLDTIVKSARKLSNTPVPNWSTFIARRATLGGASSLLHGVFPIALLTGGGAAAGGGAGALVGGLLFFGGSKALVGAISNPLNARFIKDVISPEATSIVKRAAILNIFRASAQGLREAGDVTTETATQLLESAQGIAEELFPKEAGEEE